MKSRDIALGLIVVVFLIAGVLWIRKVRMDKALRLQATPTPTTEEKISKSFNNLQVPDNIRKVELTDVAGGDGFGIATSDMVLADLPDLQPGYFYQVWLEKDGRLLSLGKMRVAKVGWLLEGQISGKVVVSQEKVFDNNLETRVLEGSL